MGLATFAWVDSDIRIMKPLNAGGGWHAIKQSLKYAHRAGGIIRMMRAMLSKNACKTCALGMGGQRGGMVNERGNFPSVCKKSMQAMAADLQGAIRGGFFERFSVDQLRRMTPRDLELSGRIVKPLYLGKHATHYREVSWEEALDGLVGKLRETEPNESFFYFSGRSSNEAGFLLQLFARLYGTNNVNNCSFYCHQASGVGLASVTGSGTATVTLDDLDDADMVFLIGGNPASNHPRLMGELMELRRRGGKVVVVNPAKELGLVRFKVPSDVRSLLFGSSIASTYIQPHIGGDIAFLTGVAKAVGELGRIDTSFVDRFTDGGAAYLSYIDGIAWSDIVAGCGVEESLIRRVAKDYALAKNVVFCWAMGITHHAHGVENVQAIANLAMLRGMLGRSGAGLLPLRGHSNVQGIGSMGVTPKLKAAVFERIQRDLKVSLPDTSGMDTMACMEAATQDRVRFALCLGGNLYASNPDQQFAAKAMQKIDSVVYLSTTLNTGHAHGTGKETWILPVQARDEETQATTQESMFNFVRLSDGGKARYEGPRSEVDVIQSLAASYFGDDSPIDWSKFAEHRNIRKAIAAAIPGYEKIGEIDENKKGGEFQIAGRTFHEPVFATESKKAQFHNVSIPPLLGEVGELRLMTVRSEGQFNTVVYEEEDIYRNQERRDVILMNPEDIQARNLEADQRVTVSSATGKMSNILVRPFDIRSGNAIMYYPEANILVPKTTDARSKTPAFKNVGVTVKPSAHSNGARFVPAESVGYASE